MTKLRILPAVAPALLGVLACMQPMEVRADTIQKSGPVIVVSGSEFKAYSPKVTALSNGNFVVTWAVRRDSSERDVEGIRARTFSRSGKPLRPPFDVNTTIEGVQIQPQITTLGSGFVIAWLNEYYTVRAQRFSSAGAKQGKEFRVGSGGGNGNSLATLTGGFVSLLAQESDLIGRHFDRNGLLHSGPFRANTTGPAFGGKLVSLDSKTLVAAWAGPEGINGQRLTRTGAKLGAEFFVNDETEENHIRRAADIARLTASRFVVAWADRPGFSDYDVRARILESDWKQVGSEFFVTRAAGSPFGSGPAPDVAAFPDGRFVIAWRNFSDEIRVRGYSRGGKLIGKEVVAGRSALDFPTQDGWDCAALDDRTFVIVWAASTRDVRAQILRIVGYQSTSGLGR